MNPIEKLAEKFKECPGIGERQAKRFVYFLLHKNPTYVKELGDEILKIKNTIRQCPSCYLFFQKDDNTNSNLCTVCINENTDHTSLLIIEKDADYENIKRSKIYGGMYFVLGGLVPIVTKETINFVRTKELIKIVEDRIKNNKLKEIIIAFALSPQGEHTDMNIRELLSKIKEIENVKISSLGRGLSTGSELEYTDSETIKNALLNRN